MGFIILEGWKEGMQKVALTMIQRELLKISLVEAKSNVDKLLDGEIIMIEESDEELACLFIKKATEIGVVCHYQYKLKM